MSDAAEIPVEADHYSFRSFAELDRSKKGFRDRAQAAIAGMPQLQRANGATYFRITETDDGIWCEGWDKQPVHPCVPAPFNPPLMKATA